MIKNLAIIPARGGSKGIPGKNLIFLRGKELLSYSIEAAIQSGCFDEICVISDSKQIQDFAKKFKITVIDEPEELGGDDVKMIDVVNHVISHYGKSDQDIDIITLLQPTSPLRTAEHIRFALEEYNKNTEYRSLVSFCEVEHHPYKSFFLLENNEVSPAFGEEKISLPRQLLPRMIRQNGAIYINRSDDLKKNKSFFNAPCYPFLMDRQPSFDIDTQEDLLIADMFLSKQSYKNIGDFDCSSFVFLIGGAFQGKSLLSIQIAEKYIFSGVLSTDFFRNILRIQKPSTEILCSTSELTQQIFDKQRSEISKLMLEMLKFHAERGEKLVVEGVHFSREFLEFVVKNGAKCIFIDNNLPWIERVKLKGITTPITRIINQKTGEEEYAHSESITDVNSISYLKKEEKYQKMHEILLVDANFLNLRKVSYSDIKVGFAEICRIIDE